MKNQTNDTFSLAHTRWKCQYHIVFAPKYRRKIIFGALRAEIGKILRELCRRKDIEIVEAHAMPDHIHMLVSIPPNGATPLLHSDQGWQYQMREFQRMLAEHNIRQSMSRKGNCLDNSCMENFFGRLKTEMFYGETFQSTDEFIRTLEEYLWYYNNERISLKLKGMSPVQYRTHSQI